MSGLPRPSDLAAGAVFAQNVLRVAEEGAGKPMPEGMRRWIGGALAAAYAQGRLDERNHAEAPPGAVGEA